MGLACISPPSPPPPSHAGNTSATKLLQRRTTNNMILYRIQHIWSKDTTQKQRSGNRLERLFGLNASGEDMMTPMEKEWQKSDLDGDGKLDRAEIKLLLLRLNVRKITEREFEKRFLQFDEDKSGFLDKEEFRRFYSQLQSLPDISVIPELQGTFDISHVQRFLQEQARLNEDYAITPPAESDVAISLPDCEDLIIAYTAQCATHTIHETLARMMADPKRNRAWRDDSIHDMTMPLSHYFISSSHNTYIDGNQLHGTSSSTALKHALLQGVRVIELDVFYKNNHVVVYHKNSLISAISFKECMDVIAQFAFVASEYPVILTLENHCNEEGKQELMNIVRQVLGDRLFVWDGTDGVTPVYGMYEGSDHGGESLGSFATALDEDENDDVVDDLVGKLDSVMEEHHRKSPSLPQESSATTTPSHDEYDDEYETPNHHGNDFWKCGPRQWLSPAQLKGKVILRDKINRGDVIDRYTYIKNQSLKHVTDVMPARAWKSSSSVDEGMLAKLVKHVGKDGFTKYVADHLLRVYPAGHRVDSSNYDPSPAWSLGVQIVALNMQTVDEHVLCNRGKFKSSGGIGWVLKPPYLWPVGGGVTSSGRPQILRVTVISAHYLPKPDWRDENTEVIDPYVVVRVRGGPDKNPEFSTPYIEDNGFDPSWANQLDKTTFEFRITRPELAVLSFTVLDHEKVLKHDLVCAVSFPVLLIRLGYRIVPLEFSDGTPVPGGACLFCRFENEYEKSDVGQRLL